MERTHGRQDMGRIRTRPATGFEQPRLPPALQEGLKQQLLGAPGHQAAAKLTQHRGIKARVLQGQGQQVFPVQPAAHRVGRLHIRQPFGKLQHRHHRQPPGRFGRLAAPGKQPRKLLIPKQCAKFVAQPQVSVPFGKGRPRHLRRVSGHLV